MLRISADALAYACQSSGRSCKGWPVEAAREPAQALPARLAGLPRYEGRAVLVGGDPASTLHYRTLAFENGQCVFLNPDQRCDLHARFASSAKPLICRQYPHLAVVSPLGTEISLTYSCPSAAKRLLDPGPFRILEDPPGAPLMTYAKEVPATYPLQIEAGRPTTWEGLRTEEAALLASLAGEGDPARDLSTARQRLSGGGALPVPARTGLERLAVQAVALAAACRRDAKPWTEDALTLNRLEGFAEKGWASTEKAWDGSEAWGAYRRYLSAKCFGNLLFITYGMIPAFQAVLLLGLLLRLEAARRASGRRVGPLDVKEAAETVDRLFPHESGVFDFWSRKGNALDAVAPPVSAALILAGAPPFNLT